MGWSVEGRGVERVVVEFGGRGVVGDCCDLSIAESKGVGGVSRRLHGVKLDGEIVQYVGVVVVIVREVDVDIKACIVLGVTGVNAVDVVVLDYYRVEALCCRVEEERVLKVLPSGGVVKIYRICREVGAVIGRR